MQNIAMKISRKLLFFVFALPNEKRVALSEVVENFSDEVDNS